MSAPRVFAHRGGMGEAVASSLEAFRRVRSLPDVGFELDIHPTRDERLVVFHDDRLEPTTNRTGAVHDFTLAELQAEVDLAAGTCGAPVRMCALDEVLALLGDRGCSIDIKEDLGAGSFIETRLYELIEELDLVEQVVVASFLDGPLGRFRSIGSHVATAASTAEAVGWYQNFLRRQHCDRPFQVLSLPSTFMGQEYLSAELVEFAHAEELDVWVWTINEEEEVRRMASLGVDVLVTDYPTRALAALGTR